MEGDLGKRGRDEGASNLEPSPKAFLSNLARKVINANRLTRMNLLNAKVTQHPKIKIPIDAVVQHASSKKDFNVEEVILDILIQHVKEKGKFKNLDDALKLLEGIADIDFSKFIADKNEANMFLNRVMSRATSKYETQVLEIDPSSNIEFTPRLTGKRYTHAPELGFFDNLYKIWLAGEREKCYIIYEQKEDDSIYIDMIRCQPNGATRPENKSVKGSGQVMIYDLLRFLIKSKFGREKNYDVNTVVCLTPEHSAGRYEHIIGKTSANLNKYYSDMGFKEEYGWCATIGDIMGRIDKKIGITSPNDAPYVEGLLNRLSTIIESDVNDDDDDYVYGGGRRKRTKNKRTKRKSKKSKKTRKRRN